MANELGFLDNSTQIKIPTGGDWVPSGMIGQWLARVLFGFWTETDPGIDNSLPKADAVFKRGRGWQMYYVDAKVANQVGKAFGQEYAAKQSWVWQSPNSKILNMDEENRAKFGDPLVFDHCQVTSLSSKKYRHELHLIALPAMVATVARLLGYETPAMDFRDLLTNQAIFDDAFARRMVGIDGDYKESVLFGQRTAIWAALGEPDGTKYTPKGTNDKTDTASDKLSKCLSVLTNPWKSSVWGRVVQVPDPRVDAIFGDESKRLSIPALTEIFPSQKEAQAAATEELKARAERAGTKAESADGSVPAAWKDDPNTWHEWITNTVKPLLTGKPGPIARKEIEKQFGHNEANATVDEIYNAVMAK